jgi:RNA polymerase sigma factor (sigma-70 family)
MTPMNETGTAAPGRDATEVRWAEWMAAAQQGDAAAYRKLLEEILPVVRRWVRARLFEENLVEDVVQNALLNLHRARATYRPERPFVPWMRAIVRNASIDALRERGRRLSREIVVEELDALPNASTQPDLGPEDQSLSPELQAALAALPEGQREAVELIHVHGLSVAAAAARAGTTVGALKVRAHRGYKAMRITLGANR